MATRCKRMIMFGKILLTRLFSSIRRFPETLLFSSATAIVLLFLNHKDYGMGVVETGESLKRLAAVLALGIPLSLCLKIYFERKPFLKTPLRIMIYIIAAAGLMLYYFFLLKDFEMVSLTRYVAVSLALYLLFTFIPYLFRRESYELYVIKLFVSFLIAFLFASVLFGGVSAILGTISYLFSAKITGKIYLDIWLIVGGIFAPAFFLADIPPSDQELDPESYPGVISILLSYIVMPLILIYCTILYVYFIKTLVTQQWPEVMVSHLVLWYAIVSILALFCIYSQRQINRWIKSFSDFFPKLILPLLGLMFVAMGIRINAYGVTENRYFVLAAGLWVSGSMIYLSVSKKARSVFLPVSLALVAVLSVFGPWDAYSVSRRSQNRRFNKIAVEYNLIHDGKVAKPSAILPETAKEEISSIINYFARYHGLAHLKALPDGFKKDQMETLFGFPLYEYPTDNDSESYFHYFLEDEETCWDISGFDYLIEFSSDTKHCSAGGLEVTYLPEDDELRITLQGKPIYSQRVGDMATKLHRDNAGGNSGGQLSKKEMTLLERHGDLRLLYIFKVIGGWEKKNTGEIKIEHIEFLLFIDFKR